MVRPSTGLADDAALPFLEDDGVRGTRGRGDALEEAAGEEGVCGGEEGGDALGAVEAVGVRVGGYDGVVSGGGGEEEGGEGGVWVEVARGEGPGGGAEGGGGEGGEDGADGGEFGGGVRVEEGG